MDYYNEYCYFKNEQRKTVVCSQLIAHLSIPTSPPLWLICYPVFLTVPEITLDKIKGVCLKRPKEYDNDKNFSAQPYPYVQGVKGINGQDEETDWQLPSPL